MTLAMIVKIGHYTPVTITHFYQKLTMIWFFSCYSGLTGSLWAMNLDVDSAIAEAGLVITHAVHYRFEVTDLSWDEPGFPTLSNHVAQYVH